MATGHPLSVCIVTADIVGPIRNGGIGTWYHALATALAEEGHRVTVLYTLGQWCENKNLDHWIDWYRQRNIEFVPLPPYTQSIIDAALWVRISFEVCEWLKSRELAGQVFDVIHFHEWRGNGFYPTLARRQGLALQKSVICVGTHSPLLWHKFGMGEFINDLEELQVDHLERSSVANADVVVSPSRYMIDWITEQGWKLPPRVEIRQYIQSHFVPTDPAYQPTRQPVRELVFFGRLETRKGVVLLCNALDRIADKLGNDFQVTFLGKRSIVEGIEAQAYLEKRATAWPFKWSVVDTLDHAGAIEYLRQNDRLAVICSLVENSPNTVLECLVNRVPCLCTRIGGNPELIADADRDRATFLPRPAELAKKILTAVVEGFTPARPAVAPEETRRQWLEWHERIATEITSPSPHFSGDPVVSYCLVHRNRPQYLQQALESLAAQDYPRVEVVLVDDGSDDPAAIQFLDNIQGDFARRDWQLIRQENRYLGAARNAAARAARGDFLIFMDDDNVAKPQQASTFIRAARYSGADLLTCPLDGFTGPSRPVEGNPETHRWLAIGGAVNVGVFDNLIGDANGLMKKSVFNALGGFTEDFGVGHEDWELFGKAILNDYVVQVVPEALYFYRVSTGSMLRTTSGFANFMRSLRPWLQTYPKLRTTLEYAVSLFMTLKRRTADASALYDRTLDYENRLSVRSAELLAMTAERDALAKLAQTAQATAQVAQAAAERRAAEAEAVVNQLQAQITANGDPAPYQRMVDAYWNSFSWRITSPLRNTARRVRGRPVQERPVIHDRAEADQVIDSIRNSLSWEAFAPLRMIGRAVNKLRRK